MRRIVFHIGLAKTGTTAFQHFCHRHREYLRQRNVLYPRCHTGRSGNHSPFVASYIDHRPEGPTVAIRWKQRAEAVRRLRAEIDASTAQTILISSEHFSMHFDRSEALELLHDFADFDCRIVIALRDAHARFLSTYNTHVTAGGCLPLQEYARTTLIPGTRYMSARETVLIWQEAFGRDHIDLIDYDVTSDMAAAILRFCDIEERLPKVAHQRRRVSLDPKSLEALRCANTVVVARQKVAADRSLAAWAQLSLFSILCRRRLQRPSEAERNWMVSRATKQALDEIAEDDQRWVAKTYGIQLRGDGTRAKIQVGAPPQPDAAAMSRAESLVARATRGLWAPSQALVMLWDRVAATRNLV